ncbi:N-acetylmuramoyl-L-alanine amidase [Gordonia aichiensis]
MSDPTWLPDVLRAAGLRCDVYPGAFDRGHGDFGNIWGIVAHHTGSFGETPRGIAEHPALGLASQLYLSRDGVYTLCGVGIAWHAGEGSWPGLPTNNANQCTIGIEAANDGTSGWSAAQYNAYVRGCAAILNKLGQPSSHVIGHKEWAAIQGKWDPGGINMNTFRADVARVQAELRGGAPKPVPVVNQIDAQAKVATWLGKRSFSGEKPCKDGVGRFADFEHGSIYWHPKTGAYAIPKGGLYEAFSARKWEQGELGYPVRVHAVLDRGGVQAFQGGVLYVLNGGDPKGHVVHGVIGARWAKEGYEKGALGWPTSDEYADGNGRRQDFEHGSLLWDPSGAVKILNGKA